MFVTRRSAPRIGFPGAGAPDPLTADRWFWPVPARRTAVACAVRGLPSPVIGPGDVLPEEDCDPCASLVSWWRKRIESFSLGLCRVFQVRTGAEWHRVAQVYESLPAVVSKTESWDFDLVHQVELRF